MSYRTYAVCRCKSCSYLGYNPGLFGGTGTAVYRSTWTQINERPLDLLSRPVANKARSVNDNFCLIFFFFCGLSVEKN